MTKSSNDLIEHIPKVSHSSSFDTCDRDKEPEADNAVALVSLAACVAAEPSRERAGRFFRMEVAISSSRAGRERPPEVSS